MVQIIEQDKCYMENKRPLLSICIPTYNRALALKRNLECLVELSGFDEEVEIVISDNCSPDNTREIGEYFASKYSNIKYYRNEKNIRDANFSLAINRGHGEYKKLLNDNAVILPNGLLYLKSIIRENLQDRCPLFFTDDQIFTKKKADVINCKDLNEYILALSAFITAISCFGVWREQWEAIEDKEKFATYLLSQVDWSFQIVCKFGGCKLYDKQYYYGFHPGGVRKGYNWFDVHMNNFYKIMQPYIERGFVSKETVRKDKINHLYHFKPELFQIFFFPWRSYWKYDTEGSFKILWSHCKNIRYFYYLMASAPIWGTWEYIIKKKILKPILQKMGLIKYFRK